jgi:type I restriction enzyme S subunit
MSTATLHSEKKKTLLPQLRFQEFDGEWKSEKLLKHVYSISSGKIKPSDEGEFLVYGSTGIIGKSNIYTHEGDYILVARVGANAGQINRAKGKYAVTDNTLIVDLKESISVSFCESFLIKFNLNKLIFGSGQPLITGGLLKSIDFVFPDLLEQQKIASFLSSVDEKIQQLTRKSALLEQYKKEVMLQLFSGKLRFKDDSGKDYPNWEEKMLGELGELKNGLNKDKKDFGFGSPFVNLMNVFGKSEIYNQEFDLVNSNEKEKILYNVLKGDVLFIRSSVKRTGVGETVIVQEDLLDTVYSGFLIRFRDDKKSLTQDFKKYCFSSQSFRNELLSYATSSANTNINQESLNKVIVKLPCINEQQKIANFLSGIDSKIEMVNQQLAQTQTFKKGLLQQMFV